jgi:hypothetical protein
VASWVLRKLNLLRVPASVEIAGLDVVSYQHDIFAPEFGSAPDMIIEPDGTRLPVDEVQKAELQALGNGRRAPDERVPV